MPQGAPARSRSCLASSWLNVDPVSKHKLAIRRLWHQTIKTGLRRLGVLSLLSIFLHGLRDQPSYGTTVSAYDGEAPGSQAARLKYYGGPK